MSDLRRLCLAACVLCALACGWRVEAQEKYETLVNTLGTFPISFEAPLPGIGGLTAAQFQAIGPRLVLDEPKVISEIGAIVFSPLPMLVQVRPADPNGGPDPTAVIASYLLSHRQPPAFRYESVRPNLLLPPGTYFVLFLSQPNFYPPNGRMDGALAQTRGDAFLAESFPAGSLNMETGESVFSKGEIAAVRVLAIKAEGAASTQAAPANRDWQVEQKSSGYLVITGVPVRVNAGASGTATATCPAGTNMTGGGFGTDVPPGSSASPAQMNVHSSGVSRASAWSVSGSNGAPGTPGQNRDLTLSAYAVCAPAQEPKPQPAAPAKNPN